MQNDKLYTLIHFLLLTPPQLDTLSYLNIFIKETWKHFFT